jgi:hypothetical protein
MMAEDGHGEMLSILKISDAPKNVGLIASKRYQATKSNTGYDLVTGHIAGISGVLNLAVSNTQINLFPIGYVNF